NIITASPANDTITPLLALNASVTLASSDGERIVQLADFYQGYRQSVMRRDELLTQINIPTMTENAAGIFLKLALRRAQAISVIDTAVILRF
ncbi:MAG TPA: FAD binding domain-containing protein, partial [Aggregatilineales bacterium]|nr:FAD binding domain-containing protein [Aggregatilineales bacterium]